MRAYLERPDVQGITYNKTKKCFQTADGFTHGGLHSYLERQYYPHLAAKHRRSKPRGGGSSKAIGIRVDQELAAAARGRRDTKRPVHEFTAAILAHFKSIGHRLCAAQVPVRLRAIGRITQADVITMAMDGQLWMWEIKTGGTLQLHRAQGMLGGRYAHVPCSTAARFELQRHYTHQALCSEGVPLVASRVLVVRKSIKGVVSCKELENAPWLV